ncbi:MAG: cytochrome c biogenesis protein ResB [Kiritimatiellales bacterium]|jgi:hypothetical protein
MKFAVIIFSALTLFLLAGVIPVPGGLHADSIYYSPVFMFLLLLLSLLSVRCCARRKVSLKQSGFYLVHLGVVLILSGAFAGYLIGVKGVLQLSVKPPVATDRLPVAGHEPVKFGFDVAAEDFQVKYYPPMYQLFRLLPAEKTVPGQMPYEKAGEFAAGADGVCEVKGLGPVSNLWNEARQEWASRKMLPDGSFLHLAGQTPSFFGVTLMIEGRKLPVSINHPADYKGWRFYLMSYDQQNQSYVQLSVRRDPGRTAVIAGIWVVIAGAFIFCFRKEGGSL